MDFRKSLMEYLERDEETTDYELQEFIEDVIAPNQGSLPILYRFSPADYNNIRALETQTLYLSEAGKQNDIFEGLSCPVNDETISNIEKMSDLAFIKSFTETKDDLKMWSMYADNYAGMCVAYDFRHAEEEWMYHLFPVCYSDKRVTKKELEDAAYELKKLKSDMEEGFVIEESYSIRDIMAIFLMKSRAWENEKEWRFLVTYPQLKLDENDFPDEESNFFYGISDKTLDVPYATDVYLGPKMPSKVKEHIREIADRLKIRVHEMKLDKEKYELTE